MGSGSPTNAADILASDSASRRERAYEADFLANKVTNQATTPALTMNTRTLAWLDPVSAGAEGTLVKKGSIGLHSASALAATAATMAVTKPLTAATMATTKP